LKEEYPQIEFSVILGEDNYANLDKWKNHREIMDNYRLLIYPRRKSNSTNMINQNTNNDQTVMCTEAPMIEISSTYIRESILNKQDVQYLLTDPVISYIGNNHLYE
jgi:nicotinate-nucleotide adenylyltransferase